VQIYPWKHNLGQENYTAY